MPSNADETSIYQVNLLKKRLAEVETELENERIEKEEAERYISSLENDLENVRKDLEEQLEDTTTMITRKKDEEMARVKKNMQEMSSENDEAINLLKNKHNQQILQLQDEVTSLKRIRNRLDQEKTDLVQEMDQVTSDLSKALGEKAKSDEQVRRLEAKVAEHSGKVLSLESKIQDMDVLVNKQAKEINFAKHLNEDYEMETQNLRGKIQKIENDLNKANVVVNDERRDQEDPEQRQNHKLKLERSEWVGIEEGEHIILLAAKQDVQRSLTYASNSVMELEKQLEIETKAKESIQEKLVAANDEIQHWRTKYADDTSSKEEELDETRKKLTQKLKEAEDTVRTLEGKVENLEQIKIEKSSEVEQLLISVEEAEGTISSLKTKMKATEVQLTEAKNQNETMRKESLFTKRQLEKLAAEVPKLEAKIGDMEKETAGMKIDNKLLKEKVNNLAEKLGDSQNRCEELNERFENMKKSRDELRNSVEELEQCLADEKEKVVVLQNDFNVLKTDFIKREKELKEDAESQRINMERSLVAYKNDLEKETKAKQEQQKLRKKMEEDVEILTETVEEYKLTTSDQTKTIKKLQQQMKEISNILESEQRISSEREGKLVVLEQKYEAETKELNDTKLKLADAERLASKYNRECEESTATIKAITLQNSGLALEKRELENDLYLVKDQIADQTEIMKEALAKASKATTDATKLAIDNEALKKAVAISDEERAEMEKELLVVKGRLNDLEEISNRMFKAQTRKLEDKLRETENDREIEAKKAIEFQKAVKRMEKRVKEIQVVMEAEKKSATNALDEVEIQKQLVRKLRQDIDTVKAEGELYKSKYQKALHEVEDAEARKDHAMKALQGRNRKGRVGF